MKKALLLFSLVSMAGFAMAQRQKTVTDIDGNVYQTVKIGKQLWLAENMRATRYADGVPIPLVTGEKEWEALSAQDKAYCWLRNDQASFAQTMGALYTWAAAVNATDGSVSATGKVQGVCPDGWHIPSDEEFKQLEMHLGMSREEADKTKLRGTNEGCKLAGNAAEWADGRLKQDPDFGKSGFMALPGGLRYVTGKFGDYKLDAYWWTGRALNAEKAYGRIIPSKDIESYRDAHRKDAGFSVRCIKN